MKTKPLILLLGAITLAAGTALVARALMRPPPPITIVKEVPVESAPVRQVLAARASVAPGQFIDGAALVWRDLQGAEVRVGHFVASNETERRQLERGLYGATVRRPVAAEEALTRDLLVQAGEPGFLAAVLTPGMRAASIPTNAVASNAGLVSAGDWVDVILSLERDTLLQQPPSPNSQPFSQLASQTILRRVRVLALNNNTASITPATAVSAEVGSEAGETNGRSAPRNAPRVAFESLTLEVTPAQAEQLAVAREVGTLQVALRGVREAEPSAATGTPILASTRASNTGVTRLSDATAIFTRPQAPAPASPVMVKTYHGAQQATQTFGSTP